MIEKMYLRSLEHGSWKDWKECKPLKEMYFEKTRGIIVELLLPVSGDLYNIREDIKRLILFPRHVGFSIDNLPCHVYICLPGDGTDEYSIIDWGLLNDKPEDD